MFLFSSCSFTPLVPFRYLIVCSFLSWYYFLFIFLVLPSLFFSSFFLSYSVPFSFSPPPPPLSPPFSSPAPFHTPSPLSPNSVSYHQRFFFFSSLWCIIMPQMIPNKNNGQMQSWGDIKEIRFIYAWCFYGMRCKSVTRFTARRQQKIEQQFQRTTLNRLVVFVNFLKFVNFMQIWYGVVIKLSYFLFSRRWNCELWPSGCGAV